MFTRRSLVYRYPNPCPYTKFVYPYWDTTPDKRIEGQKEDWQQESPRRKSGESGEAEINNMNKKPGNGISTKNEEYKHTTIKINSYAFLIPVNLDLVGTKRPFERP